MATLQTLSMEKRAMKYMCRDKEDTACIGVGDTPEDALADYLNDFGTINFNQFEWFVFEPITPPKPTIKKATK